MLARNIDPHLGPRASKAELTQKLTDHLRFVTAPDQAPTGEAMPLSSFAAKNANTMTMTLPEVILAQ